MDPRQRLALGDSDDERPFQAAGVVAANKVQRFEGLNRKSKLEREKELEAERQRKEAEEAAQAYRDFVEAFGGDEETGPSQGARPRVGGAVKTAGKGFVRAGGEERYNPLADRPPPPPSAAPGPSAAGPSAPPTGPKVPTGPRALAQPKYANRPTAANLMGDDDEPQELVKPTGPPGRKKREGDNFLEQLKRDQAAREERLKQQAGRVGASVTALAAREHAPVVTGSYDMGDPLTTNLHVGGLPSNVTEDAFGKMFARFGPIGSLKIMWPRLDSGNLATTGGRKLGGFVAYLRRPDAERAAKEMDGAEWGDNTLKIGWGKAVPLPATALYEPEPDVSYHRDRERTLSTYARRTRSRSGSRSRSRSPDDPVEFLRSKRRKRADAGSSRARVWPELEDGAEENLLATVAKKVRENGRAFEEVLREKEKDSPRFAFLRDDKLPSYHYFRMLVDPEYEPPQVAHFDDEGNADIYSSDSSEDSEGERVGKGKLGKLAQKRFECMLRGLDSKRERIARGMAFALEHADCASYIADILVCSLTIDTTPVPRKLARLHLVSDILHNAAASVPNAWTYRSVFEAKLPAVFDHLGDIYLSFPGRLKAEQFRGLIEKVIDVWANDWMLFEPSVIEDFKRRLAGLDVVDETSSSASAAAGDSAAMDAEILAFAESLPPEVAAALNAPVLPQAHEQETAPGGGGGFKSSFKAAAFAPAEPDAATVDEAEDVDGEAVAMQADDDVDGAPVDDDVDGAPVADDVDGAAIVAEEDIDGAPVATAEDDVDGEPAPGAMKEKKQTETVVLADDGDDGDAMDMSDDDIFR